MYSQITCTSNPLYTCNIKFNSIYTQMYTLAVVTQTAIESIALALRNLTHSIDKSALQKTIYLHCPANFWIKLYTYRKPRAVDINHHGRIGLKIVNKYTTAKKKSPHTPLGIIFVCKWGGFFCLIYRWIYNKSQMDRAWTVSEEMYILDTTEIRVWQEPAHCIYECIYSKPDFTWNRRMVYLFWFMGTRSEAPIKHLAFGFQSLCEDDPRAVDTQVLGKIFDSARQRFKVSCWLICGKSPRVDFLCAYLVRCHAGLLPVEKRLSRQ